MAGLDPKSSTLAWSARDAVLHIIRFQESVDLVPGFETEQAPEVGSGQAADTVFVRDQGFKRAPFKVSAGAGEPAGDIVGNADDQVHG